MQLNKANIRCLMVTGDNLSTAISVAKDCGIINSKQNFLVAKIDEESTLTLQWLQKNKEETTL